jgi:DNA adenine methylase
VISLYRELGYVLKMLDAPRMISCTGDRTRVREVLALKGF